MVSILSHMQQYPRTPPTSLFERRLSAIGSSRQELSARDLSRRARLNSFYAAIHSGLLPMLYVMTERRRLLLYFTCFTLKVNLCLNGQETECNIQTASSQCSKAFDDRAPKKQLAMGRWFIDGAGLESNLNVNSQLFRNSLRIYCRLHLTFSTFCCILSVGPLLVPRTL